MQLIQTKPLLVTHSMNPEKPTAELKFFSSALTIVRNDIFQFRHFGFK
jgi:hypothetical protein